MGLYDLISGSSDPYMGVRQGVTKQKLDVTGSRVGPSYEVNDAIDTQGVFGGVRNGPLSVEIGGGPLSRRTSHNKSDIYDIRQDIDTDYAYLAGLRHFNLGSLSPHVLAGLARVAFRNHEYGSNENGPNQEHRNKGSDIAPMLGLGFTWAPSFLRPMTVRGDYFRINNVAKSQWTKSSDIAGGFLGLQYPF